MRVAWGAVAVVLVLLCGTLGLHVIYGTSWLQSVYGTLALMTTAGDNRIVPVTPGQVVFTFVLLAVGTALWIYWLSIVVAALLRMDLTRKERRMQDRLSRLEGHYVVVGAGRVGRRVAQELTQGGVVVVIVDTDATRIEAVEDEAALAVALPAYDVEHFRRVRLDRAQGLALALPDDAQNLYAYLAAQDSNPNLRVVARAQTQESAHHLRRLGVGEVVLPDLAGGYRMGRMLLKPRAHELLRTLTDETGVAVHEVEVDAGHPMANQPVRHVRQAFDASYTLLGYWREGTTRLAPPADELLHVGDVLILLQQGAP